MRTSRFAAVAVISSSLSLLAACSDGGGGGGPVLDPPQVTLVLPQPSIAGKTFPMEVSVTGCDPATKIEIFDDQLLLRTLPFSGNPMTFNLESNEIPYRNGVAATPLFKAKAFCSDGRFNTSAPQAGRFFPVDQVIRAANGAQTVTDTFVATGGGAGTTFVGCSELDGQRKVVAVDTLGSVINQAAHAIACSDFTSFSERTIHGARWLMEPYDRANPSKPSGVIEFDDRAGVNRLAPLTTFSSEALAMGVAPDGGLVVAIFNDVNSNILELRKLRHANGTVGPGGGVFTQPVILAGIPISNIVIDSSQQIVVASWETPIGGNNVGNVVVERFDYRTGARVAKYLMREIAYGLGEAPPIPNARLNASGSVVFFPLQITSVNSQVIACATRTPNCTNVPGADGQPAGLLWTSEVLTAPVIVAQPYASDSRIAAISATKAWFLSAYSGQIRNPGQQPIIPEGALSFLAFQEGRGRDFYLLSGAARPTELVALETAESGELIRFGLSSGSVTVAVAEDGQFWVRSGTELLKPYRLVEYRRAME